MPKEITNNIEISPGDIYEDSAYHSCLCLEVNGYEVWGISLVDGSYPRSDDIALGGVRNYLSKRLGYGKQKDLQTWC